MERLQENAHREKKREVERIVKESNVWVEGEFGRQLSEKGGDSKKLFWKEIERVRGGEVGEFRERRCCTDQILLYRCCRLAPGKGKEIICGICRFRNCI